MCRHDATGGGPAAAHRRPAVPLLAAPLRAGGDGPPSPRQRRGCRFARTTLRAAAIGVTARWWTLPAASPPEAPLPAGSHGLRRRGPRNYFGCKVHQPRRRLWRGLVAAAKPAAAPPAALPNVSGDGQRRRAQPTYELPESRPAASLPTPPPAPRVMASYSANRSASLHGRRRPASLRTAAPLLLCRFAASGAPPSALRRTTAPLPAAPLQSGSYRPQRRRQRLPCTSVAAARGAAAGCAPPPAQRGCTSRQQAMPQNAGGGGRPP